MTVNQDIGGNFMKYTKYIEVFFMKYKTYEISGPKEKFLALPGDNPWIRNNETSGCSEDDGKGNWTWTVDINIADRSAKDALKLFKKHGLTVTDLSNKQSKDMSR